MRGRPVAGLSVAVSLLLAVAACSGRSPEAPSQTLLFKVSHASVVGQSASYTGGCPVALSFIVTLSGEVQSNGTYQYTYLWERENGQTSPAKTSTFGVTAAANGSPYSFGNSEPPYLLTINASTTGTLRAHVSAPNEIVSDPVPFSVTCLAQGAVLSQKTVTVEMSQTVDLEGGVVGWEPADVWYAAVTRAEYYLTPLPGARLAVYGTAVPGYSVCSTATLTSADVPLMGLGKGIYLCAMTRHGHYAQLRLEQLPVPNVGGNIVVTYTTWY